jgi:alpha-galactosidase
MRLLLPSVRLRRTPSKTWTLLVSVAFTLGAISAARGAPLAATPPMGWNDWNAYGCRIDARDVRANALFLHRSGLERAGYRYVIVDDCWMARHRSPSGGLRADPRRFPGGIRKLAAYVHSLGLKFGLYEDAGLKTCQGRPGSFGHYREDARTFARWGVDYVKFDWCHVPFRRFPGLSPGAVARRLYGRMARALRATGRPIVFSICEWGLYHPWRWAPKIANLWRTTGDIAPTFGSILRHFHENIWLGRFARPGHWNNPDMLEIGTGRLTLGEERTEISLWAMMAAPLVIGADFETMNPALLPILGNRAVIGVDQDPLARPAWIVRARDGHDVLARRLAGGRTAVLLLNETARPVRIRVPLRALGSVPRPAGTRLGNLWSGTIGALPSRAIVRTVRPHGVVFLELLPPARFRAPSVPPTSGEGA